MCEHNPSLASAKEACMFLLFQDTFLFLKAALQGMPLLTTGLRVCIRVAGVSGAPLVELAHPATPKHDEHTASAGRGPSAAGKHQLSLGTIWLHRALGCR